MEAYFAMQVATVDGVRVAMDGEQRYVIMCIHNASDKYDRPSLVDMVSTKTPKQMHDVLKKHDIAVTNNKDKDVMLPFVETGNGFLGCWLGAVAMTYAMMPHVPWYIKGKDRADTKAMAASMKIVEEKAAFKTQEGSVPESAVAAESSLPGAPQY